jgi:hypothetical protein
MMKVLNKPLSWYVTQLNKDKRFSFVRYGNGEWDCILDLYHRTRSGSQYFNNGLQDALSETLKLEPPDNYYVAIQSTTFLASVGILRQAEKWLSRYRLSYPWYDGEVFHKASRNEQLYPLIKALHKKKVVVVGPHWLMALPFSNTFIPIRPKNCWQDFPDIYRRLIGLHNAVISFSAGPAAKVLIRRLYPVIGDNCWLIDFGSMWDPYCGVQSRRYHKTLRPENLARNLVGT